MYSLELRFFTGAENTQAYMYNLRPTHDIIPLDGCQSFHPPIFSLYTTGVVDTLLTISPPLADTHTHYVCYIC